ncbi:uncharacterized protein [Dysidea avara]|uniref:uncharacterized protein isoform X4 n=1 Tax=Dysidea avara TaxID=196820 RepID=UPI00332C7CF5
MGWSLENSQRFREDSIDKHYCSEADAVIMVYDCCDQGSYSSIDGWNYEMYCYLADKLDDNMPVIMVANKKDKLKEATEEATTNYIDFKIAQKKAATLGYMCMETSAKSGENIQKLFKMIAKTLVDNHCPKVPDTVNMLTERDVERKLILDRAKRLQQNLNKAKKQHGTLPVRFLKLFFTGSGAAGKTSFVNLLLKKRINKDHHSTNVVHSSHAVSCKMAAFQGSPDSINWIELGSDVEIGFLKSVLLPTKTTSSLPAPHTPQSTKDSVQPLQSLPTDILVKQSYKHPVQQEVSLKQWVTGLFVKSVKGSSLSTFQTILNSASQSTFTHRPGEVLNIITLLDTGGQPQYIHLLPTININPTVTFVVHDLSKSLDDQVLVEYSQHGKHIFTPYHLRYSNRDMIKLLMSSANDALERSPPKIPHLAPISSTNNSSYICLVGTHADKVPKQVKTKTADQLAALVDKTHCSKAAVWQTTEGSVLFSVDNSTAGSRLDEDPIANIIRNRIETLAREKEVYELPITWMLLELEIRQACAKKQKSYMSFDDCFALANKTGLISDKEEVRSVLLYHHLLGVLIYFAEVPGLCDYVITDHQWWFDKLSSIICVTFQQASLNRHDFHKLKYEGLFSKDLLQHIEWEEDIKEEFFLSLLVHMRIIAPVVVEEKKEEYFIPFVLPTFTLQQRDEILLHYGQLLGQPLLVQFRSGLLPRGFFCSLIVELLQHSPKGWHPHFSHDGVHHTFSNLITFSLPDGYSLSLFDKVSYLEVQMRHINNDSPSSIHIKASYNYLVYALTEVCIHLNFDYERLQYGFLCQCGKSTEDHIAVLPETLSSTTIYAQCSINSVFRIKLEAPQLMWLVYNENYLPAENGSTDDMTPLTVVKTPDQPAIKRPAMRLLHEVVIPRIAADWSLVADYLEYEVEDKKLIREKCHHDPLKCCVELLENWLSTDKGASPKSWSKLIEILRQIKILTSTTEKIVQDLAKAGVFV